MGQEVVKPRYDKIYKFNSNNHKEWALVKLNNKYGFIDLNGKEVVAPIYDSIGNYGEKHPFWAEVSINNKKTFIDEDGNTVIKKK